MKTGFRLHTMKDYKGDFLLVDRKTSNQFICAEGADFILHNQNKNLKEGTEYKLRVQTENPEEDGWMKVSICILKNKKRFEFFYLTLENNNDKYRSYCLYPYLFSKVKDILEKKSKQFEQNNREHFIEYIVYIKLQEQK